MARIFQTVMIAKLFRQKASRRPQNIGNKAAAAKRPHFAHGCIKPSMNSSENFLPVGYNKLEYSLAEGLTLPYLESAIFLLSLTNLSLNFTSYG